MKTLLEKKIKYYYSQETKTIRKFLSSNRRQERDEVIRVQERLQVYQELMGELKEIV